MNFGTITVHSSLKKYPVVFTQSWQKEVLSLLNKTRVLMVVDQTVASLNQEFFKGVDCPIIEVDAKESHKTLDYSVEIIKKFLDYKVQKKTTVLAIGGGITQEITSFVTSIYYRGLNWHYFPTTLLSQVDSCIGGKNSLNFDNFKNILGTFNPPNSIFLDFHFLDSLESQELHGGIGEIIKIFLISGIDNYYYLAENIQGLYQDRNVLHHFIYSALILKKNIIETDEFDSELRKCLNFGHTFGHAIERISNNKISHGVAVSMGILLASHFSHVKGLLNKNNLQKIGSLLKKNLQNFKEFSLELDELFQVMLYDKKNDGHDISLILINNEFRPEIHQISEKKTLESTVKFFNDYLICV